MRGRERERERRGLRRRQRGLAVLGGLGELLLTLGLVLTLFAVYSVWWTNLVADRSAARAADRLRGSWSAPASAAPVPGPSPSLPPAPEPVPERTYQAGDDVGFLHVPAMGAGFQVLIRMGTDPSVLADAVAGVYQEPYRAAMPWEAQGNFALAAHRDGHGAKFHNLDAVKPGDPVVVETRDRWYVYRVDGTLPETAPDDVGVIAPVPKESPYHSPGRYITLTTCTPVYTSRYRMVVWGSLVREEPMDPGRTPPEELR